ncbi:SpvB/TcaC N-terminal domain-containing protein [Micromonospora sp. NPDC049836]|uniref:SpvB/TcaC N-terminal domain-containing protein n=1 Tax=Micromonospora sp. NPDC049836 TaxID=3364274 RepID=UPI00378B8BB8
MGDGGGTDPVAGGAAISLPTGGGAVKGMGEAFSADLFTGTGNLSVPFAIPPGRRGVQPTLALGYSTGHGNGPFGLGWALSLPGVTRKTSRGVPRYQGEDTFLLSGAEDLVPVAGADPGRTRYRPRTEGLFARIEHVRDGTGDYWAVRDRGGLLTHYGTPHRAAGEPDPATVRDPDRADRIFGWRVTGTVDPLGNQVRYTYLRDRGETDGHRWDQPLLSRIEYADYGDPAQPSFLVAVQFEYEPRPDPFSDHRAGFEIRTSLRCRAVRVVTRAADGQQRVAREYRLAYAQARFTGVSLLTGVEVVGIDESGPTRREEALPSLAFGYSGFDPAGRRFTPISGPGLPTSPLNDPELALVDLRGNGLPDLVELGAGWRSWRNRGDGRFDLPRPIDEAPPVALSQAGVRFLDADGDGRPDLLVTAGARSGYFPLSFGVDRAGPGWSRSSFRPYRQAPSVDLADPAVRLVDLDGDGLTDVLRSGTRLECWFNDADPRRAWQRTAVAAGPAVDLSDPQVRLADMTGDGLQDIVLVRDGNVTYWPNLGHGRWGPAVQMRHAPRLPSGYDPRRLLLGDVDGDGVADLVYLDHGRVLLWGNQAGNGWTEQPVTVTGTPDLVDSDAVQLADLLGTGMAGLLWSRAAAGTHRVTPRFLDLTGGVKPYLLCTVDNQLGARTTVDYRPSTVDYRRDEADPATRWRTPLPYPVQVVARVRSTDQISGGQVTREYRYHHGYWDGAEREFRGFAMVEQRDAETVDPADTYDTPPTLTKTWFHVGPVAAADAADWAELELSHEYWPGDPARLTRPTAMAAWLAGLARPDRRDALRALRGQVLRTELYALDGGARQHRPYTVTEALSGLREEPAAGPRRVFFPYPVARRVTQWERGDDPMTRVTVSTEPDRYGNPTGQLDVAVPRGRDPWSTAPVAAEPYLATYTTTRYAQRDDAGRYLVDRVCETRCVEVRDDGRQSVAALRDAVLAGTAPLRVVGHARSYYDGDPYTGLPLGQLGEHALVVRAESLAFTDDFLADLGGRPPFLDPAGGDPWPAEYPPEFRAMTAPLAGYRYDGGGYYLTRACHRYGARGLLLASRDAFGAESRFGYDEHDLLPVQAVDPAGLTTTAAYDLRVLLPREVVDANGNRTSVSFSPIGLVTARYDRGAPGEGDAVEPTVRLEYDLRAFAERGQPASVRTVHRAYHDTQTDVPLPRRDEAIVSVEYSDGFGRLVQTRTLAEDTLAGDPQFGGAVVPTDQSLPVGPVVTRTRPADAPDNVTVSGWTVYNNKGQPVHAYEPFFATGWGFAAPGEAQLGQRVSTCYDPRGQVVRTVQPDGSEQRVVFGVPVDLTDPDVVTPTPWESWTYDANDNAGRSHGSAAEAYRSHWNTPASAELDALGRTVRGVTRNGADPADWFVTRSSFDIQGNLLTVTDPLDRVAFRFRVDLAGRRWRMESVDAGVRDTVPDASDVAIESRDGRGALHLAAFDPLRRPVRVWARDGADDPVTLRQRVEYGDAGRADQPAAERDAARARNLLGRAVRQYDEAGLVTVESVDFKGNVRESTRRMIADGPILAGYAQAAAHGWQVSAFRVDWTPPPGRTRDEHEADLLEPTAYRTSTAFDALNRIMRHTLPADVDGRRRELRPSYNRAGELDRMLLDDTVHLARIHYDARGQRTLVEYGNGVVTRQAYDSRTSRLARLYSARDGQVLQDHGYEYDLVGNVLTIRDRTPGGGLPLRPDALDRQFGYDPAYRLCRATGRESDVTTDVLPWTDLPRGTDVTRTRPYLETYGYDAAGSLVRLAHSSTGGFTREHTVEPGSNRLRRVTTGGTPYDYRYDANGNLCAETTSRHFTWNHADQLVSFAVQPAGAEPSVHAQYLYDAGGQRVKKLVRRQGGAVEVTHYLGEVFEHHRWAGATAGGASGANNTIHVLDNRRRVALVRVGPAHPADTGPAIQVHLADHVGSATVVLDGAGLLTNREEFTPYGETSFGSFTRKRYRYAGKERDEESGLNYHAARYLHPGLGRWLSCDPQGPRVQPNLYRFAAGSPLRFQDPSGAGDQQVEAIATFLQQLADDFLEPAQVRLSGEGSSPFGTRMHDMLQGILESARFNAPNVAANRIVTEVIVDPSGNIWDFAGKPGGAPKGSVTIDVAILEKGVSSADQLVGRKAKDVLAAGIDYKTGDARLAQHQREFFESIKKPLFKLSAGGDLAGDMTARSTLRKPRGSAGRSSQRGSVDVELLNSMAAIGLVIGFQLLVTGEMPTAKDVVRIGVETTYPIVGIMEAKDHNGTVIPIMCYFAPEACGIAVAGVAIGYIGVKSVEVAAEKGNEVLGKTYSGLTRIYGYGSLGF